MRCRWYWRVVWAINIRWPVNSLALLKRVFCVSSWVVKVQCVEYDLYPLSTRAFECKPDGHVSRVWGGEPGTAERAITSLWTGVHLVVIRSWNKEKEQLNY